MLIKMDGKLLCPSVWILSLVQHPHLRRIYRQSLQREGGTGPMSGVSVAVFAVAPIALLCSCWVMCSYYNVRRKQARRYAATPPSRIFSTS